MAAVEFEGTLATNLAAAVQSARRLKGHPVHPDTIAYWTNLLQHARREVTRGNSEPVLAMILDLEHELADRPD
jgi:hypothetical protein